MTKPHRPETDFTDIRPDYWLFRLLPAWAIPYGIMARWDRPIGWWLLFLPCLWGIALGVLHPSITTHTANTGVTGPYGLTTTPMGGAVGYALIFWIGAIAMRGAGCVWNDIADRHLDGSVERTQHRPIPAGLVTIPQALVFMGLQGLVGLAVLTSLPIYAIWVALASVGLVVIYPFMKRITYFPQFVLGLAFNWGVWVGYTAMGHTLDTTVMTGVVVLVYLAGVLWTVGYDTIYALQDIEDDIATGIKSTAIRFQHHPQSFVKVMYGGMIILLALALWLVNSPPLPYVGLGALVLQFYTMVTHMNPQSQGQNLRLFKANKWSGLLVTAVLLAAGVPL